MKREGEKETKTWFPKTLSNGEDLTGRVWLLLVQRGDREGGARGQAEEGAAAGGRCFPFQQKCLNARPPAAGKVRGTAAPLLAVAPSGQQGRQAGGGRPLRLPSPPPLSVGLFRCLYRGPKRPSRAPGVPGSGSSLHGQGAPGIPAPAAAAFMQLAAAASAWR